MKIVMVSSELAPYSKSGGLGEAVSGLSRALAALGQQVTCLVPYYRCSWESARAKPTGMKLTVPIGQKQVTADIWETALGPTGGESAGQGNGGAKAGSVQVVFVRRDEYYDRSELYATAERDYEDNAERFIFLSKIAVEWMRVRELYPDVVHSHDWQTALVPLLVRLDEQAQKRRLATKTMFTIHNLAYQGIFWSLDFPMTNLPWQFFTPDGLEFYGQINLMKAGILFSDLLTTVSPRYAQEIQTTECGNGLEVPIKSRADHLHGIRNGIDIAEWDPLRDPYIARHFSADDLEGKKACKAALLDTLGMPGDDDRPLVGIISRLTEQKGLSLLEEGFERLLKTHFRFAVLGTGDPKHEKFWLDAAKRHPKQVAVRLACDEPLTHQIEAGSDFFLMPSRSEPCGLHQMFSLRYGTVPIVRATGGLADTVHGFNPQTGEGNGFRFEEFSSAALVAACQEALAVYENAALWRRLQRNAMAYDVSWSDAARRYLTLYEKG